MIRFMVQNGLAMYCTWCCIATLLNSAQCLTYRGDVPQDISSSIMLGCLGFELIMWFILDTFVWYKYTNYIFMPYVVVVVALVGSIEKNFVVWSRNIIITVVLLGVAALAFSVKIVLMTFRAYRNKL